jgi:hypothetical protein
VTRPADPPGKGRDALGGRFERDVIGALLGLMGAAALWWAGSWWWRAAHAEASPAPRPPAVDTALLPAPPRFDRGRALALLAASLGPWGADAGAEQAAAPLVLPAPSPMSYGSEQGHGSESWSQGARSERVDFEPRYPLDAGAFEEPPPVAVEAPRAFH